MRTFGLPALALAVSLLAPRDASAQPYPDATPAPRTTSPAAMHELANDREIVERIRLGVADEKRKDWDDAVAEFSEVLTLKPHEPQGSTAFYDLGIGRAGQADFAGAAEAFRAAIARDPGFLAARANLVSVELSSGDLAAAREAASALIAAAPDSARALYASGLVALKIGDAAAAQAAFRKLLVSDPAYAVAHYDLAIAEQTLGSFGEAERELRTAIGLAPGYERARLALGAVLLREGKRDEARLAFDDAVRATPDPTLRNLAVSLRDAIQVTR
jgi:tetratricopeptide (TPR) repeat protein